MADTLITIEKPLTKAFRDNSIDNGRSGMVTP